MDRRRARRALAVMVVVAAVIALGGSSGRAEEGARVRGVNAVTSMAGCYLVDYSYTEVESLRPGYVRDARVYDVNRDKSVKEWIQADAISPGRIRLDRVLFATDLAGAVRPGSVIRHQAEDWEYEAPFLYDFVAPGRWVVKDLRGTPDLWTRRVTNLDDGLRYQCAARWAPDTAYPEWSCTNYAPIPGRETRDMGRADYDALQRATRIVVYGQSWLERQDNIKTSDGDGGRRPLARELGKNWYVRLPDAECAEGQAFARARQPFWTLLRETWDGVLRGESALVETAPAGQPPRFVKMWQVEQEYLGQDLSDPAVRSAARARIIEVIEAYRRR